MIPNNSVNPKINNIRFRLLSAYTLHVKNNFLLHGNYNNKLVTWMFVAIISFSSVLIQSCSGPVYVTNRPAVVHREVMPPAWAPVYDNVEEVHYYYLPDIEAYYDVWNNEFVYLHDGNWIFTSSLPVYYSNYDVNNSFVVVLDFHVNEPWRHHQTYASHYPRYYYRSAYNNNGHNTTVINNNTTVYNNTNMRGFNENKKNVLYNNSRSSNNPSGRYTRSGNNTNLPSNNAQPSSHNNINNNSNNSNIPSRSANTDRRRQENNNTTNDNFRREPSNNSRQDVKNNNNQPSNNNEKVTDIKRTPDSPAEHHETKPSEHQDNNPRRTEPAVYSGKEVGQPVRVTREMKSPKENERRENKPSVKQEQNTNQTKSNSSDDNSKTNRRR
jgi:hypothetical protein